MEENPTTKRGGARPGAGRKPRHEAAGNTYTFRLGGKAEEALLAQSLGRRNAYVEAALLAYQSK